MERKVGLHRVEPIGSEEALAQGRHAEIDDGVGKPGAAQSAQTDMGLPRPERTVAGCDGSG